MAECLVRVEGNIECRKGQGVLADHEVLMVMDEDGVLHGVAEEKDDLVKGGTWVPGEAKGVPATKFH